jgi:hypothetical protein
MTSDVPLASRCVLVLGMHQSGTSVLARALIALGVDFGSQLLRGRADNPKGFFEDADANVINDAFLEKIGSRWHSLRLPTDIPSEYVESYRNEIRSKVLDKFTDTPFWGLKEPRITHLLPHWLAAMKGAAIQPLFLLANRHPYSVTASLTRRDGLPVAQSLALWALHQLEGLSAIAEHGGLVVDYDLLMASPKQTVERLATFLETPSHLRSEEIDLFIKEFLQADLRHAQHTEHSPASTPLQALCLDLHRQILDLAVTPKIKSADLSICNFNCAGDHAGLPCPHGSHDRVDGGGRHLACPTQRKSFPASRGAGRTTGPLGHGKRKTAQDPSPTGMAGKSFAYQALSTTQGPTAEVANRR